MGRATTDPRRLRLRRAITALSGAGFILNIAILDVHHRLASSGGDYTSFCNVSDRVNCDAVLESVYATLLGLPVAAWGTFVYGAMIALSLVPGVAATLPLLALASWSAGYSVVMAGVSFGVLRTVCLLCTGLYLVAAGLFFLSLRRAALEAGVRRALVATLPPMAFALTFGYLTAVGMPTEDRIDSLADLLAKEPDFYRWYRAQPVVPEAAELPSNSVHVKGNPNAAVTIIEYSDFACHHCARARSDLERLLEHRSQDVRLVFRHFPLDTSCNPEVTRSVHPTACAAAAAAVCAGEQGKFWEFHDYLFDNPDSLDYLRVATALGLDGERLQSCLASGRGELIVARDVAAAAALGVNSTPTIFFNGREIKGALDSRFYELALLIEKGGAIHRARTH